jgi:hypothetical protein
MTDLFAGWVRAQEQMIAMQKAQLDAATRAMGVSEHFVGAAKAAQAAGEAQVKAWETWMALWGFRR